MPSDSCALDQASAAAKSGVARNSLISSRSFSQPMPATEEMKQIAEPFGSWFFSSSRSMRWRWPMKLIFNRSVVPSATPAAENRAWMGPLICSSAASIEAGSRRSTCTDWATS